MMSARCRPMFVARFLKLLLLGSWGFLPVWAAPKITDFAPPYGAPGATITIYGTGLGKVNAVNFNGAQATLTFVGPTALKVIVPLTAVNGPIFVRDSDGFTYDSGAALLPDFLTTPRITTVKRVFPPANTPEEEVRVAPGSIVEVTGANYLSFTDPRFHQAVRVEFTGPNGPIRVVPNSVGITILQATVPNGAISGPLTVLTPIGSAQTPGDLYFQPIVTSFTPVAPVSAIIELVGRSFKGATQVLFGTQLVTPLTVSATNLTVRVPLITGPVRLTLITPGGAFITAGNFALSPTITAFAPAGGPASTPVSITGTGLAGATKVRFGSVDATVISASPGEVKTLVPLAAITGPITVITPFGTNTSTTAFFLPPQLTSVVPNRAKPGVTVALNGRSLTGVTAVRFAGTLAEFQRINDTLITATVPEGAVTGPVVVENPGGITLPGVAFSVLGREPIIDDFTPDAGTLGTVVTLVGLNFTGTTAINFSNAPASTFAVLSDTNLTVTVPNGAKSGPIEVKNGFGTGRSLRVFIVGNESALSLTLSANPQSVLAGEPLVLRLELSNAGPLPAAGSTVTLKIADGLDYVDSTLIAGSINFLVDGLVWEVGTVGVNQTILGFLRMRPRFVGNFGVEATAATSTPEPVISDNVRELTAFALLPHLEIRGVEDGQWVLGWPARAVDYILYRSPSLTPPIWAPVTNVPVPIQDELRVAVPLTDREHWFRLAPR